MNRRIIAAIAVIIIGLAAIGAWVYAGMDKEENRQKVAMTELPVAVQKTIQDNLGGGTVTKTAKETKRSVPINRRITAAIAVIIGLVAIGALVYAGMDKEENKQKVAMTELPTAVQKTIQDNLGGGTVTETAKETKGGKTYYEAEVQKSGGEKVEIKVAEDGSLVGVGKEEDDD